MLDTVLETVCPWHGDYKRVTSVVRRCVADLAPTADAAIPTLPPVLEGLAFLIDNYTRVTGPFLITA